MAFTQVRKAHGRIAADNSVTATKGRKNGQLLFRMSKDIFEAIGSPARVEFFAGTGEDQGSVLISPSVDGKHSYSLWTNPRSPNLYCCGISAARLGLDAPETATDAVFEVTEDGLVVRTPEVSVKAEQNSQPRRTIQRFSAAA